MIGRSISIVVLAIVFGWTKPAQAQSIQTLIADAMEECHLGRVAQERAIRLAHFRKGQRLGEQAVALDGQEAEAHFALFCNLGEAMRIDGELSLSSILSFRRLMKELDRTLELAPEHLDALSSRGTLLVRLPFLLGGDRDKGEQLLQYVIEKDPQSINARLSLAKSYSTYGRHQDALTLASEALTLAQAQQRSDFIPEATRFITQLRTTANKAK
jgi:tetratricopeptide (TPR) repeat protein